ncbi:MAG: hypothetical protein B7Z15_01615, partial [Rhizobiales bacterium 32-66-8]
MREGPVVQDAAAAGLRLSQALERLDAVQRAGVDGLLDAYPLARRVLQGIAEDSSFLLDLIRTDPGRLARALEVSPVERIAA